MNLAVRRLCFLLIFLVAVTLPFPIIHINSGIIITSLCCSLIHFIFFDRKKIWRNKYFLCFLVLYFMHYLGFINSEHTDLVSFDIEQKLSFLALPLIFVLGPIWDQKKAGLIMVGFMAATAIVCLLSFRNGFHWGYSDTKLYENLLVRHPYLGMYSVVCVFLSVHLMSLEAKKRWKAIYFLSVVFFIFFLFVLFAKMAIVSFFILSFVYLIGILLQREKYVPIAVLTLSLLVVLSYFALVNDRGKIISNKIKSWSEFSWDEYDPVLVNSLNLRFIYWTCSKYILTEDKNWLFGVGTGDVQLTLDQCYLDNLGPGNTALLGHHDTHNQYFLTWLSLGLFPLLFFVGHFLFFLYTHFQNNNLIAFTFTLGMMLFCTTESIMENQKGVVFYALFQSLFVFSEYTKRLKYKSSAVSCQ